MLPQWSVAKQSQYKSINLFDQKEFAQFLLIWYLHLLFIGYTNGFQVRMILLYVLKTRCLLP